MAANTENEYTEDQAPISSGEKPHRDDHAAFEEMVRRETPRLYRVILRIVRDEDEAQSLVQETFLKAYQGLDRFRGDSSFSTWLTSIGINTARYSLRKRSREDVLSEEDIERLQPSFRMGRYAQAPRAWKPLRQAEQADRRRFVRKAISRLPDSFREIITLRDLEELSTEETAEALGISNNNARVRLHRARQALRALLEQHLNDEDL